MSKNIGRERILRQAKNMQKDQTDYLRAYPLETDLYTWHFTFRGPQNTDFHEGLYHGQILLPFQYPFKPPDIVFANKNGRFEVNTKICLTITQYHAQQWNSAWTIRTMLEAVISLFNERVMGHGYLQSSSQARQFFAKASHQYTCEKCGKINQILKPRQPFNKNKKQQIKTEQKKQQKQQIKIPYKQMQKQKPKQPTYQIKQQKPATKIKTQQIKNQNKKKKNKVQKISAQQFFIQTLMQGNQEYQSVINSKKLLNQ